MKKVAQIAPDVIDYEVVDYKISPSLAGKYDDQPLFAEKLKRANKILDKTGVPKF